jgi:hypothetical protein
MDNFELAQFNVTCHTEGCENTEITIEVSAVAEAPHVICGPCGIQIEDVVPVG